MTRWGILSGIEQFMHELTLCRSIVEIALSKAPANSKIVAIYVEVGELAAIDARALLFSFDLLAEKTMLAGAKLTIIPIAGQARCNGCHTIFSLSQYDTACSQCAGHAVTIIAGEELRIKSMEVSYVRDLWV